MLERDTAAASDDPQVSVIIPTYEHADLVLETLASVFAQDWEDREVVVVNDGSPDDTREVLRPLVEAGRIRYVEQANQGQAAARNRGLSVARGKYVAFLDDDDLWPPEKLSWQVDRLRRNPSAVLVYGTYAQLQPDGSLTAAPRDEYPQGRVEDDFLKGCWLASLGQSLIRASALRDVGGLDDGIWGSDDWDLYIRLAREGEFVYENRLSLKHRVHNRRASRHALRHARNKFRVMLKHRPWDWRLKRTQLERGAGYFVPNLRRAIDESLQRGQILRALEGCLYTAVFRPRYLLSPWRIRSALRRFAGAVGRAFGPRRNMFV